MNSLSTTVRLIWNDCSPVMAMILQSSVLIMSYVGALFACLTNKSDYAIILLTIVIMKILFDYHTDTISEDNKINIYVMFTMISLFATLGLLWIHDYLHIVWMENYNGINRLSFMILIILLSPGIIICIVSVILFASGIIYFLMIEPVMISYQYIKSKVFHDMAKS